MCTWVSCVCTDKHLCIPWHATEWNAKSSAGVWVLNPGSHAETKKPRDDDIYLFIFVLKQGLNYVPKPGPGPPHPPKCLDLNMSTMPGIRPVFIQSFAVLKALFKLPSVFLPSSQNTMSLRWGGTGFFISLCEHQREHIQVECLLLQNLSLQSCFLWSWKTIFRKDIYYT